MHKTLRISFALKNTYRVNTILYSLKQIPGLKHLLPDTMYQEPVLKILANILSVIWEILSAFLGKFLYLLLMVFGVGMLYNTADPGRLFLHILFFLTVIGAFANTYMFNPSKDKYYAMILMRMNAREYTLVNYGYAIGKVVIGFLPFSLLLGIRSGVPVWICLLIPFFIAGAKLMVAAYTLWDYERRGTPGNENQLGKLGWILLFLLLAAAYAPPAAGWMLPKGLVVGGMLITIAAGGISIWKILTFREYREMYRQLLNQQRNEQETASQIVREQNRKVISADAGITSNRKGFEYLNELFMKRHQKILWRPSKRIAAVCLCIVIGLLILIWFLPEVKKDVNDVLLVYLPYFSFLMYLMNRGTGFTQALFMNCDHSLLTYPCYKKPACILKLFRIRLREIIKVNLLPAGVIGLGLAVLLYASGGTENPVNYAVLVVSILCMSIFFSVHYLTMYYLLQPFNAETELKSGTYRIVSSGTYLVCYLLMKVRMSILLFGGMTIVFCVVYSAIACVLVYRLAPKTFRIRR